MPFRFDFVIAVAVPFVSDDTFDGPIMQEFPSIDAYIMAAKAMVLGIPGDDPDSDPVEDGTSFDLYDAVMAMAVPWRRYFLLFNRNDTFELEHVALTDGLVPDQMSQLAEAIRARYRI